LNQKLTELLGLDEENKYIDLTINFKDLNENDELIKNVPIIRVKIGS